MRSTTKVPAATGDSRTESRKSHMSCSNAAAVLFWAARAHFSGPASTQVSKKKVKALSESVHSSKSLCKYIPCVINWHFKLA